MADSDLQLQVKKRARRRLVGAAAFATLSAFLLPAVMDDKPRPSTTQDIEVRVGHNTHSSANSSAQGHSSNTAASSSLANGMPVLAPVAALGAVGAAGAAVAPVACRCGLRWHGVDLSVAAGGEAGSCPGPSL